jgi:acyl-CoA thioester hydrolase
MPLTHTEQFRVRFYECDAYGHLNHATYLRFMQEAAFGASAAAGYGPEHYAATGQQWLIRETQVTYLRPVTFGQTLVVKTWVEDFRRVRSRRAYEMTLASEDEPVAHGYTDWVYVDATTSRPVAVPAPMIAAFFPEGAPRQGEKREPFPTPPPPPPDVFTLRRHVRWRDLDPAGHLNNANYVAYAEDAGIAVLSEAGWSMARMTAEGFGIVARAFRIEYLQPAVLDDELAVATWISDMRRATVYRHYTINRVSDGALVARARGRWVWIDLATGRPIRVPPAFAADFAFNASPDAAGESGS